MDSKKLTSAQNDLKQISQSIQSSTEGSISLIDIDLSLDKIRRLYELMTEVKLEVLSKPQTTVEPAKIEVATPKQEAQKAQTKVEIEEPIVITEPEIEIDFVAETIEEELPEIVSKQEESIQIKVEETIITETKTKAESILIETSETVADRFENKRSLNDILADIKNNQDLATRLKNSPIKDLKSAISLNDKIWFTRELFEGNNDQYLNAIEKFNSLNNMDEALNLANTFSWDKDEASTKHFLELIYRKFV